MGPILLWKLVLACAPATAGGALAALACRDVLRGTRPPPRRALSGVLIIIAAAIILSAALGYLATLLPLPAGIVGLFYAVRVHLRRCPGQGVAIAGALAAALALGTPMLYGGVGWMFSGSLALALGLVAALGMTQARALGPV